MSKLYKYLIPNETVSFQCFGQMYYIKNVILLCLLCCFGSTLLARDDLVLWYTSAATEWENQALPIGNGYIGGMIFGGAASEHIQFNEKTLWTGGKGEWSGYDGGSNGDVTAALAQIRALIDNDDFIGAKNAMRGIYGNKKAFGSYQTFGDFYFTFSHDVSGLSNYERKLDLNEGIAGVAYKLDGVTYQREYFCSYPDNVMVMRFTSDTPGHITFDAKFETPHSSTTVNTNGGLYTRSGNLSGNNLPLELQMKVINSGGSLSSGSDYIRVTDADTVVIIAAAGTDYVNVFPDYTGDHPHDKISGLIAAASQKTYNELKSTHLADYQGLFDKVVLDLNQTIPQKPTNEQLDSYNGNNRALEVLFFQYGRYLLISSSRPGTLPANLQGIWNNSNEPPWDADYHTNINLQMNYWLAEMTNLSETHLSLIDYIEGLLPRGKEIARNYGMRGWVCGHEQNIFGHCGFSTFLTAFWTPGAAAWLSRHVYDHFLFSRDKDFLRDRGYPIMKEAALFWVDYLYEDPDDGQLISSPSFSPEQEPFGPGCSMDQQIAWDILTNTIEASLVLGIDEAFRDTLQMRLDKLDNGLRIGSWGQLQEWKMDIDDPDNVHRHVSHLYCLHPGKQVSPLISTAYSDAAKVSLNARGDGGTGWSKAWKINFWARLLDGDRAFKLLGQQLKKSTLDNMLDTHPPFQIDGNFGATSGITEMLLQSHLAFVHLLPALPDDWDKGSIKGLRARGGFEVDFEWVGNLLTKGTIISSAGDTCRLRYKTSTLEFPTIKGVGYNIRYDGSNLILVGTSILDEYSASNNSEKWITCFQQSRQRKTLSFRFNLPEKENVQFSLYSINGKVVYKETFSNIKSGIRRVPLTTRANGVYLYTIKFNSTKMIGKVIVK